MPQVSQQAATSSGSPRPAAVQLRAASSAVSIAAYTAYRPQIWNPACTHLTMTRMYEPNFGWLYRCTQDREQMIEDAMRKGHIVSFDLLGASFEESPAPPPRGPEERSNRLSFFKEITADEMKSYTPDQIATILEQRENLHNVLGQEQERMDRVKRPFYMPSSGPNGLTDPPPGFEHLENKRPWVPDDEEECQFKCCQQCRPTAESRSYLSLDGIVKGDVPPTAAVGFGFHLQGTRPIIDADIVKNIGYRPVPVPKPVVADSVESPSSPSSIWSILEMIDEQMIEMVRIETDTDESESTLDSHLDLVKMRTPVFQDDSNGQLKSAAIRPPWTPPTTPTAWAGAQKGENGVINFEHRPSVSDGRSCDSLKTNPRLRRATFDSIRTYVDATAHGDHPNLPNPYFPYEPADANDVGLFLPFNKTVFARACITLLPPPSPAEEAYLHELAPVVEQGGRFHEEPLEVGDNGVAVMEESVGLGVPDVVAQV
ncbi:uncharacterized protein BCR38DRAFT_471985 [Pseudomassariella vexata]|uniref:Uncharacterized protein n=1 Tax=Pseudomassariella vexata TaxID=1141098 RepID=A0A1Y2EA01_9PEZI|nr:uncharacterized protein BCR38DRAFT_471985 [Pseudomassariella vexata]ORY68418.1 hypothetical protein BCR38DRAFT_471985 [Pseudomassariella vexata]